MDLEWEIEIRPPHTRTTIHKFEVGAPEINDIIKGMIQENVYGVWSLHWAENRGHKVTGEANIKLINALVELGRNSVINLDSCKLVALDLCSTQNITECELLIFFKQEKEEDDNTWFTECPQCGNEDLTREIIGECHGMVAEVLVCENCGIVIEHC